MNSKKEPAKIDDILELLSKPLTRYILSVLAGVDPGIFTESKEGIQSKSQDWENSDL